MVWRKGSFDDFDEFFADVCLHIVAPRWVPPGDFPGSSLDLHLEIYFNLS